MKHITLFLATLTAALVCVSSGYARDYRGDWNSNRVNGDVRVGVGADWDHNGEVINHGVTSYDHRPAGVPVDQIDPNQTYGCIDCPTICYVPKVEYCPQYYCEKKCYYVPQVSYKKQCRYRDEYYTKTFCRKVPEYYYTSCTTQKKCYYTERHCKYNPVCRYERVVTNNNTACPQPGGPVQSACPSCR